MARIKDSRSGDWTQNELFALASIWEKYAQLLRNLPPGDDPEPLKWDADLMVRGVLRTRRVRLDLEGRES